MLSRSSSNAGDKLRRAKSTSSTHTSSPGHSRAPTSVDPFLTRQQAATAALQAYERARMYEEPTSRPVPPKLERHRSQKAGRSEGSHFDDARKRSIARESEGSRARPSQPRHQRSMSRVRMREPEEERVITRRRSIIPPATEARSTQPNTSSSISTAGRHIRRRQSDYTEGSPAPRYSQTITEGHTSLHAATRQTDHTDGYGGNLASMSNFGAPASPSPLHPATGSHLSVLDVSHHDETPKSHIKRLRERKSFFGTFQKRRATTLGNNYDSSLPPFNYADNDEVAPIPTNMTTVAGIRVQQRSRNFSDSLKGRLKKVFRKTAKPAAHIPAQQVEARDFHFSVRNTDISEVDDTTFVDYGDPFMTVAAENPSAAAGTHLDTATSAAPSTQTSNAKSRVTSWANSTVAGMSTIRTNNGPFATTCEPQRLKQRNSSQTLRKASSFFGRPIRSKLQKTSKDDLRGSEESQSLYAALQKRIRPSKSMEPVKANAFSASEETVTTVEPLTTSALATLPSQKQYSQSIMSARSRAPSTIRPVTPQDPVYHKPGVPSPVHEVLSPDADDVDDTVIHHEVESAQSTPQSALSRRPATKAPPPSPEQLARRLERSQNRWRSTLNELSPTGPHSSRAIMVDGNPYELSSLGQDSHATPSTDLPHHAKADENHLAVRADAMRADALSPSVYSRATDGASPRSPTPEEVGMTTITITGREVRKYDISPARVAKHGPRNGSKEWRRWLSDEINNWSGDKKHFAMARNTLDCSLAEYAAARGGFSPEPEKVDSAHGSRPSSVSPVM